MGTSTTSLGKNQSKEDIESLYESLPNRIEQVLKRKGGYSKY